jgi:hypothetical protein
MDMDPKALPDDLTHINIEQPTDGTYRFAVVGTDSSYYVLRVLSYNPNVLEQGTVKHFVNIPITKGDIHKYEFDFSQKEGCKKVRGGYYGDDKENPEANKFLTYAYPSTQETNLSPGIRTLPLHIFYGKILISWRGLTASLNGEDISHLFNTIEWQDQIVRISLARGRNELVITASGLLATGRTGGDTDRFIIWVR